MKTRFCTLALMFTAAPGLALAQATPQGGHSGHSMPAQTAQPPDTPATKGYQAANEKMHRDMNIPYTGNSDVDFVRSMIPHHQGAIDMAKVALQNAEDEQVRKWATDVVREQEREISEMRAWLKAKGVQ